MTDVDYLCGECGGLPMIAEQRIWIGHTEWCVRAARIRQIESGIRP